MKMKFLLQLFQRKKPDMVRYYDPTKSTIVVIPRTELRLGVVLVRAGHAGVQTFSDCGLLQAPLAPYHVDGRCGLRADINKLAQELAYVPPGPWDEWEDNYLVSRDPAYDMATGLHVAAILGEMTKQHGFDSPRRRECFRVLVACYTGERATFRERCDPRLLTTAEVDQTVQYFFEGGYP